MGVAVSADQALALQAYIEQLQRWNRTYNLTALRHPDQMLVQHIFDSLSIVKPISEELYKNTVNNPKIMDIGSGAGLPGVVLAIMRPEWQIECVDAVQKKMAFVRQMSGSLKLPNLQATHARVEQLGPANADIVVSRAFASLADFADLAGRHVASQGWLLAMKGQSPDEEQAALQQQTNWRVSRLEPLHVPELDAQRCLVWMSRQGNL
ncbi:16S rRNA (guanine(527)-N(7))-methyltransferase RsmG [Allopusillimonas ginsengisoli]|uniref:16S rRNA (guanine(527)-N(7))-methyltransferase RsmG n=1 Tax=Allopusillimonas ginsengisoli TaxID=453575 RepID=UPI001FD70131|nr:16S rRNA (guanine(527)-N(7))-methyltransferase RsmG [Allopusillimonas ginsengisoli]